MPETAALLAAAKELEASSKALTDAFNGVDRFAHETRTIANRLIVAFVVMALILALAVIGVWKANNANDLAKRNAEYQAVSCTAGNQFRADTTTVFDNIEALLAPPGKRVSPDLAKFIANMKAAVAKAYAPRDCSKVPSTH